LYHVRHKNWRVSPFPRALLRRDQVLQLLKGCLADAADSDDIFDATIRTLLDDALSEGGADPGPIPGIVCRSSAVAVLISTLPAAVLGELNRVWGAEVLIGGGVGR